MDECVLWPKAVSDNGYGKVWFDGKLQLAHRMIYQRDYGQIPAGLHVHHKCGERACVNTAHMRLVTQAEHNRLHLGIEDGRCKHGHDLTDPANVYHHRSQTRPICRVCNRERTRAYRQRRRDGAET